MGDIEFLANFDDDVPTGEESGKVVELGGMTSVQIRLEAARLVAGVSMEMIPESDDDVWSMTSFVRDTLRLAKAIETGEDLQPAGAGSMAMSVFKPAYAQRKALYQHACGHVQAGTDDDCEACELPDEWRQLYVALESVEIETPKQSAAIVDANLLRMGLL